MKRPLVMIILDGWGMAAAWGGNAIALAKTPNMNKFIQTVPSTTLAASGEAVGLQALDPGNSEVGHLTIGSGKIIKQDLPRINEAIGDGSFQNNDILLKALNHAKTKKSRLHLIGLVSPGGVHSHTDHLFALLDMAKNQDLTDVAVHMITDGRDTSPYSAVVYLNRLEAKLTEIQLGQVATVMGRYYAMDRDNRWKRTQAAYTAITQGSPRRFATAQAAVATSYQESFTDEFIPPSTVAKEGAEPSLIKDNDAVIFFNFRNDRARQLTKAFVMPNFTGFRRRPPQVLFVTMTEYEKGLPVEVAFKQEEVAHPLAEVLAAANLTQLHVAETEKYAHVTYFLNGQREKPFPGEARVLINSPKVSTYDQLPEMAAAEVAQTVIQNINKKAYDFIVVNFANADMVGHTGNLKATIAACEITDSYVGDVVKAATDAGANVIITADHGNAEELLSPKTGEVDTSHNISPVPFMVISPDTAWQGPLKTGGLSDVAPTILAMMELSSPPEMTGRPLFETIGRSTNPSQEMVGAHG